ncbi:hypothetical protein PInf_009568 [Phytophthora infestans]|nr:hypothetical protein PInf_009568 [Phytophthora infestans]
MPGDTHTYFYTIPGSGPASSRLDRWYVTLAALEWVAHSETFDAGSRSDHKGEAVRQRTRELIQELTVRLETERYTPAKWAEVWEDFKVAVVKITLRVKNERRKAAKGGLQQKLKRLLRQQQRHLEEDRGLTGTVASITDFFAALSLEDRMFKGVSAKYQDNTIRRLDPVEGAPDRDVHDKHNSFGAAWTPILQQPATPCHAVTEVTEWMDAPASTSPEQLAVAGTITELEVTAAIQACKVGKATGPDRLGNDWYRAFAAEITPVFTILLDKWYEGGFLANGAKSRRIQVTSGIRQGSLKPLYRRLDSDTKLSGVVIQSEAGQLELRVAGYADDTAVYLRSPADAERLRTITLRLGEASGLKLNEDKIIVIALHPQGPRPGAVLPDPLKFQPQKVSGRYLGIRVGSGVSPERTWDVADAQLRVRLTLASHKTTIVDQRSLIAAAVIVPKLTYIAQHAWPAVATINRFAKKTRNYLHPERACIVTALRTLALDFGLLTITWELDAYRVDGLMLLGSSEGAQRLEWLPKAGLADLHLHHEGGELLPAAHAIPRAPARGQIADVMSWTLEKYGVLWGRIGLRDFLVVLITSFPTILARREESHEVRMAASPRDHPITATVSTHGQLVISTRAAGPACGIQLAGLQVQTWQHHLRAHNKMADLLANRAMDSLRSTQLRLDMALLDTPKWRALQPVSRPTIHDEDPSTIPLPQTPQRLDHTPPSTRGADRGAFGTTEASPYFQDSHMVTPRLKNRTRRMYAGNEGSFGRRVVRELPKVDSDGSSGDDDILVRTFDEKNPQVELMRQMNELATLNDVDPTPRIEMASRRPLDRIKPFSGSHNKSKNCMQWLRGCR